ncbi:hypothetical protein CspHIS471_0104520 [Cutaneotrichosporon sp. HIS471]|nr:hypothetical protein CspHIS471_0104520 [Cutaneotrichosporon sp. HIS471]
MLALVLLLLVTVRASGPAFVACLNQTRVMEMLASDAATPIHVNSVDTVKACSAACATDKFTYSLVSNIDPTCLCTSILDGITSEDIVTGWMNGACHPGDYTLSIATTNWLFMGCQPPPGTERMSPNDCLASCEQGWAALRPLPPPKGGWACHCAPTARLAGFNCSAEAGPWYTHRVPSARTLRIQRAQVVPGLCPAPLTACSVKDTDGWECIDTRGELESCGGCVHGVYGLPSSENGEECSTLRGVARGGAHCVNGHCEITACRFGFTLRLNGCIPW